MNGVLSEYISLSDISYWICDICKIPSIINYRWFIRELFALPIAKTEHGAINTRELLHRIVTCNSLNDRVLEGYFTSSTLFTAMFTIDLMIEDDYAVLKPITDHLTTSATEIRFWDVYAVQGKGQLEFFKAKAGSLDCFVFTGIQEKNYMFLNTQHFIMYWIERYLYRNKDFFCKMVPRFRKPSLSTSSDDEMLPK